MPYKELDRYLADNLIPPDAFCAAACAARAMAPSGLDAWLDAATPTFGERVLALIDASGRTDADVYREAHVSRQVFSKIRSEAGYRPAKRTAVSLGLALGLDAPALDDLLGLAGYALSSASRADLIVRFFVERGIHDLGTVNEALYAYGEPLL